MLEQRFKQWRHKMWHVWLLVRQLSGDDAYERYLEHHNKFHANNLNVRPPLSRQEFMKLWLANQWQATRRCC